MRHHISAHPSVNKRMRHHIYALAPVGIPKENEECRETLADWSTQRHQEPDARIT